MMPCENCWKIEVRGFSTLVPGHLAAGNWRLGDGRHQCTSLKVRSKSFSSLVILGRSRGSMRASETPFFPARAVRPLRWVKYSICSGSWWWMTKERPSTSMPRAATSVAMRNWVGSFSHNTSTLRFTFCPLKDKGFLLGNGTNWSSHACQLLGDLILFRRRDQQPFLRSGDAPSSRRDGGQALWRSFIFWAAWVWKKCRECRVSFRNV